MPSASSLFSAVFGFRKVVLEIFSELDTTKTEVLISPEASRSPKKSRRRAPGGHTMSRRAPPAAPGLGVGPLVAPRHRSSAYLFRSSGKPKGPEPPSTKSSVAAVIVNPSSGGFWSCSRHPAGEGDHHRRPLHHHACLRSDAWVVHPWTTGP